MIQKQYVISSPCEELIPENIKHKTLEFHTILFEPLYIPDEILDLEGYWRLSGVEQVIKNMSVVIASVTGESIRPSVRFNQDSHVQGIFVARNMSEITLFKDDDIYKVLIKTFYIAPDGKLTVMPLFNFTGNMEEIRETLEFASIQSFIPAVEACTEKFDGPNELLYYLFREV